MSEIPTETDAVKDINWGQIAIYAGLGIGCLALGAFVVAPMIQKQMAKKKEGNSSTTTTA